MIACVDENVGKLQAFLDETGLAANTILIFMTDNGTATGSTVWNAGMRGRKIDLYEGGHRVPFFLRWPRGHLRAPGDLEALTECQDVLPTLVDLCALKKTFRAKFDGISLAGLLRGKRDTLPDRMLVTQFSRMNKPQPTSGDAAVLWKKWRLVSGNELYDLSSDPGQQRDVISEFPEVARKMSQHYERWWKQVEPRVNEFSPISIGCPQDELVQLSPCDWRDVFLDQQAQVRRSQRNGAWTVFAERDGEYEFSLRRWPSEADIPISEGGPEYKCVDGVYAAGEALPIALARLKIAKADQSLPVKPGDKEVSFRVALKRGRCELQTWFFDAQGQELCGAYPMCMFG